MNPARPNALTPTALAFTFVATTLSAQEVIELPGRDRQIDPDFEEVYRVGVLDGESWEMLGQVVKLAFDASGNLYVFDRSGSILSESCASSYSTPRARSSASSALRAAGPASSAGP